MAGYIKTTINFDRIQKALDAAKALDNASETEKAKDMLKSMSKNILKEIE